MNEYKLIKDHGLRKKGQLIKLLPSTAKAFMSQGFIAKPKAKKTE